MQAALYWPVLQITEVPIVTFFPYLLLITARSCVF